MYLGDEETGTITFWVNTSVLRMSLARLTNIANRLPAVENAHRPERFGRVVGVQEMPTVVFEIIDAHRQIVVPFREGLNIMPVQNVARCPVLLTLAEYLAARGAATLFNGSRTGFLLRPWVFLDEKNPRCQSRMGV